MAYRQAGLDGPTFPDDQAAEFVREFRAAVAPWYRAELGTSPPLFLLRVPQASYRSGADRVVAALTGALRQQVPFAHLTAETCADVDSVWAGPDASLLSVSAGIQLFRSAPEHLTPDRSPQFDVMCGLVEYIRSHPGEWATTDDMEAALRRDAGEQRAERGGLLAFTRMEHPYAEHGITGFLAQRRWLAFVQLLPRWLWARRISRTVTRSWLGAEPVAQGSMNLFRVLDQVAAARSAQLMDGPADEEALQEFDWLILRALLEDLRRPVIGWILPGRRRSACRPVLFVKIPPAGESGARATERFLRSLYRAQGTAKPPGPLVIAVGVPSNTLLAELGNPSESTFPDASLRLADHASAGEPPVLVTISEGALAARGVPVPPVTTRTFRFSWGVRRAVKAEQRSRKGVGEEPPLSRRDAWGAMRRAAISMGQGRDSEGRRHWRALAVVGLGITVMLAAASISVRELLESFQLHGRLGPSDTPAVVTAIVALATATGTLIGVILTAFAKYVQARGQAEADLIRARAEMMRAEADVARARAGLPPVAPSANGDSPAPMSSTEPDTSELPPSGGGT